MRSSEVYLGFSVGVLKYHHFSEWNRHYFLTDFPLLYNKQILRIHSRVVQRSPLVSHHFVSCLSVHMPTNLSVRGHHLGILKFLSNDLWKDFIITLKTWSVSEQKVSECALFINWLYKLTWAESTHNFYSFECWMGKIHLGQADWIFTVWSWLLNFIWWS